ncbi:CinA family protein [Thiospirochaeta perfilievii]|uniref:CinA family protein n=1 Tax=Thiospirochaeta perfilievii TaxID=252967 RepID=A0A5C1QGK7_9SPIO|nr:CinA family protein [Thiospirochaeta perfilievii]QEN05362.1 CinA family protein [Thiospirochaeta perfilievii]
MNNKIPEIILGELLRKANLTLSTAESCTGGNIAHKITEIPGSSSYFYGGVVSYDNSVKTGVLGVNIKDIIDFGAVSKEVVEQMALGVKGLMNTDWAVATSGVAGPGGGSKDKPVGTVWIAWAGPNGVESKKFLFGNNRKDNIKISTQTAIYGLISRLS